MTLQRRPRGRPRKEEESPSLSLSLSRGLTLLRTVAQHDGLTLTELSTLTGTPAASAYRLMVTLGNHGLVEWVDADQKWTIGVEALQIGFAFQRKARIALQGRSHMQELMERTGETVNLAILDDGEVVFISQIECRETIRAFFRAGDRRPCHSSGIGKALLAELSVAKLDAVLKKRGLPSLTAKTITAKDKLTEELALIRRRGWSFDDQEGSDGMRCIAAAIFNEFHEAVGGISISGPVSRLPYDRVEALASEVMSHAAAITRAIGGVAPREREP